MVDDKRTSKRFVEAIQVKYEFGDSNLPNSTYTKNISTSGLCFRSDKPIPIDSIIKVKFKIKKSDSFISSNARVVWVEQVIEKKVYKIGVKLLDLTEADTEKIQHYISESEKNG